MELVWTRVPRRVARYAQAMNRFPTWCVAALMLAVLGLLSGCGGAGADDGGPTRMNVLVLFADDQRADTIAALGNPIIQTPHLDRLCREGVSFGRAYMQGAFQGATCVPSRAMLLTGQTLFHVDERMLRDETWPMAFGRAGYSTLVCGKWHNGEASLERTFHRGRAMYLGGMSHDPVHDNVREMDDGTLSAAHPAGGHLCAAAADEAIRFLSTPSDKPFLCYVAFDAPHDPHMPPPEFPMKYDPATIPLPPNFLPEHPFDNGEMRCRDEQLLPVPREPEDVRRMLADYYRYISFLDSQIGRILDALEASPHARNTIVVFAADSGVARGSHGLIGKQNLYELDAIRVPLIVRGPGIPRGKTTDAMCFTYDVLPTLGRMCGVPGPSTSDGIDLRPVLHDPAKAARTEMVFAYRDVQRAIVTPEWKLIRYPRAERVQLYNLKEDPFEMRNLADRPEQASRVAQLTDRMRKGLVAAGAKDP